MPINYGLKPRHIPNQENQKPKKSKVVINIKLPTRKKIMRYVAFFVVILGIGFFTPQTNSYHKERGTFNLIGKFDTSFNFTLNKKKLVYLPPLTMPIEKTTKFITNNIVKPTPKTKDDNKYQVIIASTKSKSEANRMRNIYMKNFNKIEIIERKGYFRVSAMGFNNKNKAYQFAQSIRRKYSQFEDAWVSEK
ncbi:MAG: hypothetical protein CR965_02330 [Paludibacter sp.]|nr:MAG: hypothetical protein CR965_02330 [Paludibacter sp.]